ncbi:hypothetical protein LR48_Vigan09g115200 [Vigna angularis]|uniref:Uncharacterized protein n=1 Tax=Phaseolus angularis TaxID=3914 RepID=A0A0L9VBW9_PHAAN|nr:hypothetical protein LR48_Vigan09g115200 [Vigna angularis]
MALSAPKGVPWRQTPGTGALRRVLLAKMAPKGPMEGVQRCTRLSRLEARSVWCQVGKEPPKEQQFCHNQPSHSNNVQQLSLKKKSSHQEGGRHGGLDGIPRLMNREHIQQSHGSRGDASVGLVKKGNIQQQLHNSTTKQASPAKEAATAIEEEGLDV